MQRYGICDIARQVGMSPATVSLVLNDKWAKKVRPEIARRVMALAARHGYTGNPAARSLVLRRHFRVALCVAQSSVNRPVIGSFSFHALLAELAGRLGAHRYAMNVVTFNPADSDRTFASAVSENDALVFMGWHEAELAGLLRGRPQAVPVPALALDCEVAPRLAGCVVVDPAPGITRALEYFVAAGHRRIAFVRGEMQAGRFASKLAVYRAVLRRHRIPARPELVLDYPELSPVARGYAAGERLLAINPRPTAVFCSDTVCAMGLTHVLRERGADVPRDIEIIAYGDLSLADLCVPPLSFVQLPTAILAEKAVAHLLDLMNGGAAPARTACPAELILRGTTRAPRSDSR